MYSPTGTVDFLSLTGVTLEQGFKDDNDDSSADSIANMSPSTAAQELLDFKHINYKPNTKVTLGNINEITMEKIKDKQNVKRSPDASVSYMVFLSLLVHILF